MFWGIWIYFRSGSDIICNQERERGGKKKRVDHFKGDIKLSFDTSCIFFITENGNNSVLDLQKEIDLPSLTIQTNNCVLSSIPMMILIYCK